MTKQVKWMHQGMAGAPVLTNNWGSLTALLDACLVYGFNLQTVIAITQGRAQPDSQEMSG